MKAFLLPVAVMVILPCVLMLWEELLHMFHLKEYFLKNIRPNRFAPFLQTGKLKKVTSN